jgi:hypothetical protein
MRGISLPGQIKKKDANKNSKRKTSRANQLADCQSAKN